MRALGIAIAEGDCAGVAGVRMCLRDIVDGCFSRHDNVVGGCREEKQGNASKEWEVLRLKSPCQRL